MDSNNPPSLILACPIHGKALHRFLATTTDGKHGLWRCSEDGHPANDELVGPLPDHRQRPAWFTDKTYVDKFARDKGMK